MITQMKLLKNILNNICNRYEIGLETSVRVSDFVFDCVHSLYQKYQKINLN